MFDGPYRGIVRKFALCIARWAVMYSTARRPHTNTPPKRTQISTLLNSVAETEMEAGIVLLDTPPLATPQTVNPLSQLPLSDSDGTPVRSDPLADTAQQSTHVLLISARRP